MKGFIFCCLLLLSFLCNADTRRAMLDRIMPIGKVTVGETAPTSTTKLSGKEIYDTACMACHATGAAGAPKLGDKAAWNLRKKQGMGTLVKRVITGYKLMPANGGCVKCDDDDIRAAVEYMVE